MTTQTERMIPMPYAMVRRVLAALNYLNVPLVEWKATTQSQLNKSAIADIEKLLVQLDHSEDNLAMVTDLPHDIADLIAGELKVSHGTAYDMMRDALGNAQPAPVQHAPCFIGTKGSAFDLPETKRAYTYKEQPGNVLAYKLGWACDSASKQRAGDNIDRGLGLLQELQKEGFGVFALGAEYTVAQPTPAPVESKETDIEILVSKGINKHIARKLFELVYARSETEAEPTAPNLSPHRESAGLHPSAPFTDLYERVNNLTDKDGAP